MRRTKDALALSIEHRAAAAPEPISLALVDGEHPHLAVVEAHANGDAGDDLDARVLATVRAASAPLGRGQLRDALHVRNERLGDALARLAAAGAVVKDGDRWAVPVPASEQGAGTER